MKKLQPKLNAALRSAIFVSGRTQRAVSIAAEVPEARLSAIIRGRVTATRFEQSRLAAVLQSSIVALFGPGSVAESTESDSAVQREFFVEGSVK